MNPAARLFARISARLRGRPRETEELRAFIDDALEWMNNRQEAVKRVFAIGSYDRFNCDQRQGVIVFSAGGVPKVLADVQFVGSTSTLTKTWLWSWANSGFLGELTTAAKHVWHIGARQGYEKLTRAKWYADDADGWDMTAVQARLTAAEGVYRIPTANGGTFLTLTNVRWASAEEPQERRPVQPSFALDRIASVDRWDAPECLGIEHLLAPAAEDFSVEDTLDSWRWLVPQRIRPLVITAFGDLFLIADSGSVLFLDMIGGKCGEVAASVEEWSEKLAQPELLDEWFMPGLLDELREAGVKLSPGQCYSAKHSIVLGGTFSAANFEPAFWQIHSHVLGSIHEQVKDLPPGTRITGIAYPRL